MTFVDKLWKVWYSYFSRILEFSLNLLFPCEYPQFNQKWCFKALHRSEAAEKKVKRCSENIQHLIEASSKPFLNSIQLVQIQILSSHTKGIRHVNLRVYKLPKQLSQTISKTKCYWYLKHSAHSKLIFFTWFLWLSKWEKYMCFMQGEVLEMGLTVTHLYY